MPAWATARRRPRGGARWVSPLLSLVMVGLLALLARFVFTGEGPLSLDQPVVGAVEYVVDGDTLNLAGQRIRIAGIDAPEHDQSCGKSGGGEWDCGTAATARMKQLARGGELTCLPEGHDRYGRMLASCRAGRTDLGRALVAEGLAVADGRYLGDEAAARAAKAGLWQGTFVRPAEWRKRGANEPVTPAVPGAGNPSRFERFLAWLLGLFGD